MRGKKIPRTWKWNPTLYAPQKYRRACRYDAFVPDELAEDYFAGRDPAMEAILLLIERERGA